MDTPSIIVALLSALALLFFSLRLGRRPKLNLPPGPNPWPIIGNLNLIGPLPHRSLHTLSKKYGPIMQLRFGSFPVVVGSSVEILKTFLKTHDAVFASRPETAAGKYIAYNYSDILWAPYGPYLRQARKICLTELFSQKRLESFEYIRREERMRFLKGLYDSVGSKISLKNHLANASLNVISRMVLGKNFLEDSEKKEIVTPAEFLEMVDEFFFLNGVMEIGDLIPWLRFLDLQGYIKRMKALSKKLDRFLEYVLDKHDERRKGVMDYEAKDMVDVLLQLGDDHTLAVRLERHGIKAITQELILGGTDTSSVAAEWVIAELLKNPNILKKATEELDKVIGKERWVEEKDIINLPYIYSVVKETMRLHPVGTLMPPHMAMEDCQVAGYDISKGTRVLINAWALGRDPNLWENPGEFWPERFIGKDIDIKGKNFELLPFGTGRRMCPGYSLAIKMILSTLANFLHGFNFKLPGEMKVEDLNMEEVFGLTVPRKYPLEVVVQPRLPPHLYAFGV